MRTKEEIQSKIEELESQLEKIPSLVGENRRMINPIWASINNEIEKLKWVLEEETE